MTLLQSFGDDRYSSLWRFSKICLLFIDTSSKTDYGLPQTLFRGRIFFKFDPLGLNLLQHMFYIVLADTISIKLSKSSSFLVVHLWRRGPWTSMKRGVEACIFLNHLFPEYKQGLAHILRKEGTFFSISVTINYHMPLQQCGKYLEANFIGSKATNW